MLRMVGGDCEARCRVTTDKSLLNMSQVCESVCLLTTLQAVVFHLPDLHWEGYNYPKYR